MNLEWSMASRPVPGQVEMGDEAWVLPTEKGFCVAVVDGLGHGKEAAEAAEKAGAVFKDQLGQEADEILKACHKALARTRGAAMSVACLDLQAGLVSWCGVGNVEGLVHPAGVPMPGASARRQRLLLKSGIVGYVLPALKLASLPLQPEDTLLFYTDGIYHEFTDQINWKLPPQTLAEQILKNWAKPTDDALVWVGRIKESA